MLQLPFYSVPLLVILTIAIDLLSFFITNGQPAKLHQQKMCTHTLEQEGYWNKNLVMR